MEELSMKYEKINVNGLDVFFRECGDPEKPVFLLLHGFPSSSHMYRNLMPYRFAYNTSSMCAYAACSIQKKADNL